MSTFDKIMITDPCSRRRSQNLSLAPSPVVAAQAGGCRRHQRHLWGRQERKVGRQALRPRLLQPGPSTLKKSPLSQISDSLAQCMVDHLLVSPSSMELRSAATHSRPVLDCGQSPKTNIRDQPLERPLHFKFQVLYQITWLPIPDLLKVF